MMVRASIVLVLPSPLEDPLSAKPVISVKRRVQAFVILAIAFFVAAGFAANRYMTAARTAPDDHPAQDMVVVPSPQDSAVKPTTPTPSPTHRRAGASSHRAITVTKVATYHRPKTRPSSVVAAEAESASSTGREVRGGRRTSASGKRLTT